jgi:hypothetical protein
MIFSKFQFSAIPSCLLAIFGVKTRDFEEKSLKTGNFTCSLYFAEYYQFL